MEGVLQFPSLERLSAVSIVAHAWNQHDIFTILLTKIPEVRHTQRVLLLMERLFAAYNPGTCNCYPTNSSKKKWLDMEDKVVTQISALPAPKVTKTQLGNLIKPLGRQIFHFYGFYLLKNEHYFDYIMGSPRKLDPPSKPRPVSPSICWSAWGTVDWKTSAELYVSDKTLDVEARYRFACLHYLEEDIRELIHRISQNYRNSLLGDKWRHCDEHNPSCDEDVVALWTRSVVKEQNLFTRNTANISYVFSHCTPFACEYVFEYLSQEEKALFFNKLWTGQHYLTGSVPSFWLRMNDMEEEELFKPCEIWYLLSCMLCWPWQSLFIDTAKRASPFMHVYDFSQVLNCIVKVIQAGFKDYDYGQLLREFWQLRPAQVKIIFLEKRLFEKLQLESKENELCELILSEAYGHREENVVDEESVRQSAEKIFGEAVEENGKKTVEDTDEEYCAKNNTTI